MRLAPIETCRLKQCAPRTSLPQDPFRGLTETSRTPAPPKQEGVDERGEIVHYDSSALFLAAIE